MTPDPDDVSDFLDDILDIFVEEPGLGVGLVLLIVLAVGFVLWWQIT